jgi:cytochrome c5
MSLTLALVGLPIFVILFIESCWEFREREPSRGAAATSQGYFGDGYDRLRYLDQGWSPAQSAWFYTVDQGSDLLPYDFFLALDSAGTEQPFRSEANVRRWRYLAQTASPLNPDALPVGFARDEYNGRTYLGFTCAACHTGQVNYHGVALRIDGGPSMADMQTFMRDLVAAVNATAQVGGDGTCSGDVCKRFVARVLARRSYRSESQITADLLATQRRIVLDESSNNGGTTGDTPSVYGYARLDAFGRIYNRVLDRVLRKQDLAEILPDLFDPAELSDVQTRLSPIIDGAQEDEVLERALPALTDAQRLKLIKGVFNPSTAPVSYPFLWDTSQHDYVQWNGIVANSTLGTVGRNAGEVIGVFGTLDWTVKNGFTVSSVLGGQGLGHSYVSYKSSIYVHNLRRIEAQLATLHSPKWPTEFPAINVNDARNGKNLFAKYCANCHAEIVRDSAERRIVANMTKVSDIATDATMAENSVKYAGYAGMLRNQYVGFPVGSVLINRRAPVAALLTQATHGVIAEPYPNANVFRRAADWISDLAIAFFSNEIQPSIKSGNYDPDTTEAPFASLRAYKGRALNGIWATAPYLHNGSVPTLYDVLLPKRSAGDPDGEEYRPDSFVVGSREFDVDKVGFVSQGYNGFVFDTTLPGNSNAGHEYGTIHDARIVKGGLTALTKDERRALLEYMKNL